jgi:hypothetical protein
MSDVLEQAAAELIARPPREALSVHELRRRVNRRRGRRSAVLGIAAIALVLAGLVAIARRPADTAVGDPIGGQNASAGIDNDGTVPCGDFGCGQFDPIAVAPGIDDFYVGPASLGDPLVSGQFWDAALRCTELDAAATTCTKIEGLGIVALVSYGTGAADQIQVGTTFGASVTIEQYAADLGPTQPDSSPTALAPTTVRGHAAVLFNDNAQYPAVLWEERPGVIVWVAVPPSRQAELGSLAEAVVVQTGPASIPGRLVVPNTGGPWTAPDNNGSALLIARFQGAECVGWGYIDKCRDGIADRTFVIPSEDSVVVAGSVPPDVDRVLVVPQSGQPIVITPFSYAGFTSRYYQTTLSNDHAQSVKWLAVDGTVLATYEVSR